MAATVSIDGTDVSGVALKGSVTRRLNRPAQATVTLPMDAAIGGAGSRLIIDGIGMPGTLAFHGFVLDCETDTGEDTGYTVYNASDPMELWNWRPVRDDTGDMTKPTVIEDEVTGPQIMDKVLDYSEYAPFIPGAAEGPLFLDRGSIAGGGVSLTGAPVDWPMTIAELASLLVSTGELDIVIDPTDPGGGVMGEVFFFNGDYGNDNTGGTIFEYAMGAHNVRRLRWNEDMSNVCNKLWYYGGPRIQTARDPAGDQHWCWNITGDDLSLAYPPGGKNSPPFSATNNPLGVRRITSQGSFGVRMEVKIWDALGDLCLGPGSVDPGRELYRRLWQVESWIRAQPRHLVHITPVRGFSTGLFDIGDLITVSAGASVRGGFTGAQRVYAYTISWEEDGPFEYSEIQTSPQDANL